MDTSQWMQGNGVVDENENSRVIEKKARPPKEEALNCPRCNSLNTKFCYYNNYSLSQPRYFCKTCRRYWTNGGSLRNVPVGGGSRKNRRPSSSVSRKATQNLSPPKSSAQDHSKIHQAGHGLNLGYNINPSTNGISEFVGLPFYIDSTTRANLGHQNPNISGSNNFIPFPNISLDSNSSSVYNSSGFSMHDVQLKPNLNFTFDGNIENGYGNLQQGAVQDHTNSSRILNFPFEDLKPSYQFNDRQERGGGEGNGNWNGMLAGGSW